MIRGANSPSHSSGGKVVSRNMHACPYELAGEKPQQRLARPIRINRPTTIRWGITKKYVRSHRHNAATKAFD